MYSRVPFVLEFNRELIQPKRHPHFWRSLLASKLPMDLDADAEADTDAHGGTDAHADIDADTDADADADTDADRH